MDALQQFTQELAAMQLREILLGGGGLISAAVLLVVAEFRK